MYVVGQYFNVHPMNGKPAKLRERYVTLLKQLVGELPRDEGYSFSLLKLFEKKLSGDRTRPDDTRYKLMDYRYYLLIDCLFVKCFYDREKSAEAAEAFVRFYGEKFRKKFTALADTFYSSETTDFLRENYHLHRVLDVVMRNRRFIERGMKKVMITANMSAGKSTLMNALAGKRVNKTQNEACTAKVHYLFNKALEDGLTYELDHDLELDADNEILMSDNTDNSGNDIYVCTRFRSLNETDANVCLIDTPGVNSSQNLSHREIASDALKNVSCDILIYLLNGTQLGTDDDMRHISYVHEAFKGRIVFLINKLDGYRSGEDSVPLAIEEVKKDLVKIGFASPEVYPISAYYADLAKKAFFGELTDIDELDELGLAKRKFRRAEMMFDKYYDISVDLGGYSDDENALLLLHTGMLSLEKLIFE